MPFVGEFSALLTAALWSISALVFASATQRLGPFTVNITRLILAAGYLVVAILALRLNINLSSSQFLYLGISGFIGLTLGDTFLFRAFREIGARVTMLIMSIAPAIAALLAFLILDERLEILGITGIIITLAGIAIVVLERKVGSAGAPLMSVSGLLFAFLAAVGQGAGLVYAKMAFIEGEVNGFVATAVRVIASLLFLLPAALFTKRYKNPVTLYRTERRGFQLTALGSVLGPFLGISFSLIAIEHTSIGVAATIMAMVPVLMLPISRFVYKEELGYRSILGAFTAVIGVAVLFLR